MLISNITKTSESRYTVIFDNEHVLKTTLKVISDHYLHVGSEFDEEELLQLEYESEYSLCELHAMKLISYQPLSRNGMVQKLVRKGENQDHAERAADRLVELGLINDAEYASMVVRHYSSKGLGRKRVENELYRHGVPKELWDEALEGLPESNDKMYTFIRTRLGEDFDNDQVRKVTASLYRKGYSWDEIKHALQQYYDELEEFK